MRCFSNAVKIVYSEWEKQGKAEDPYWVYCRLSDYCGGDYLIRQKLKLLFEVQKIVPLFSIYQLYGFPRGYVFLSNEYNAVAHLLPKAQWKTLLQTIAAAIFGNNAEEINELPQKTIVTVQKGTRINDSKSDKDTRDGTDERNSRQREKSHFRSEYFHHTDKKRNYSTEFQKFENELNRFVADICQSPFSNKPLSSGLTKSIRELVAYYTKK